MQILFLLLLGSSVMSAELLNINNSPDTTEILSTEIEVSNESEHLLVIIQNYFISKQHAERCVYKCLQLVTWSQNTEILLK